MIRRILPVLILSLLFLTGCSVQRSVVRSTMNPILAGGMEAMLAEPNLDIAETALASNLKLIEGMLRSDPENTRLLEFAAQGFTAYSLAFVEDRDPDAARELYTRGRSYANAWLIEETGTDLLAIDDLTEFEQAVATLDADALPGLFWLGNSWGSRILLSLDDIAAIADLPRVETIMRRVLELDEGYFHGFAHLFFGGYYGARPPMLGGDLAKAEEHLRRQLELTDDSILLGRLFLVRYVHLRQLDGDAARAELNAILAVDPLAGPDDTVLLNRIAQEKAQRLLDSLDEYL